MKPERPLCMKKRLKLRKFKGEVRSAPTAFGSKKSSDEWRVPRDETEKELAARLRSRLGTSEKQIPRRYPPRDDSTSRPLAALGMTARAGITAKGLGVCGFDSGSRGEDKIAAFASRDRRRTE